VYIFAYLGYICWTVNTISFVILTLQVGESGNDIKTEEATTLQWRAQPRSFT
jgi:hypothetical protein